MTEPDDHQINQLSLAFERFTRGFKVAEAITAADNALNPIDAEALLFVSEHPGCSLGDVARDVRVVATTMSSAIDRLVRKSMIERRRLEENRRSVALTATAKGHDVIQAHRGGYRKACTAMLRSIDQHERVVLIELMEKIARSEG